MFKRIFGIGMNHCSQLKYLRKPESFPTFFCKAMNLIFIWIDNRSLQNLVQQTSSLNGWSVQSFCFILGKKQFSKSAAWMAHKYLAAVRLRKHEKDDMSWFEMQNKMHENYDHPSSIISDTQKKFRFHPPFFFFFGKYDSIFLGTNKLKVLEMLRGHSIWLTRRQKQ